MEGSINKETDQEIEHNTHAMPITSFLVIASEPVRMMVHGLEVLPLAHELSALIFLTQTMDKLPSPLVLLLDQEQPTPATQATSLLERAQEPANKMEPGLEVYQPAQSLGVVD